MKIKSELKKYVRKYKFNSWFIKNLILLFILIIVPITGMVTLIYYSYGNMKKNEIKSFNDKIITDTIADFDRIIKEARTQLIYIGFNSDVELYMYDTKEIKQLNYKIKNISELIRLPVISKNYIDSIYLHSHKSNKIISIEGISDFESFGERACLDMYLQQDPGNRKNILLTPNFHNGFAKKQLSIYQNIKYGALSSGIAVMNMDLHELIQEMNIGDETQIYITDGQQILLSNNEDKIGQSVEEIKNYKSLKLHNTIIRKDYTISSRFSEESSLEVISYFELQTYQNQLNTIRNFMITFVIIMIIITICLVAFTSVQIFRPIGTIISSIEQYSNVLFGDDAILKEKDELMYILNSIQKTVKTKRDIDEELAERVRLLKKAQSVALQSQINPHFFNNTLDTINWMAMGLLGSKNEISEMTNALSRMLRMTLENTDTIIPLGTEIDHCMNYLWIQKKRYEDKFDVIWNIPKELYECKTIRIVLQPIIENAIYHGIKPLSNKGLITVIGQSLGNTIEISIEDNGLGMTAKELIDIKLSMENQIVKESKHIGITNVNQRLKLYFGEEYGVQIESKEGVGTKVTILFPYIP